MSAPDLQAMMHKWAHEWGDLTTGESFEWFVAKAAYAAGAAAEREACARETESHQESPIGTPIALPHVYCCNVAAHIRRRVKDKTNG